MNKKTFVKKIIVLMSFAMLVGFQPTVVGLFISPPNTNRYVKDGDFGSEKGDAELDAPLLGLDLLSYKNKKELAECFDLYVLACDEENVSSASHKEYSDSVGSGDEDKGESFGIPALTYDQVITKNKKEIFSYIDSCVSQCDEAMMYAEHDQKRYDFIVSQVINALANIKLCYDSLAARFPVRSGKARKSKAMKKVSKLFNSLNKKYKEYAQDCGMGFWKIIY